MKTPVTAKEWGEYCKKQLSVNGDPKVIFTLDEFQLFCHQLCCEQKQLAKIAVDDSSGYDNDLLNLRDVLNAIDNSKMPEL